MMTSLQPRLMLGATALAILSATLIMPLTGEFALGAALTLLATFIIIL